MSQHPAKTMLWVWGLCVATFLALPFQLLGRELTVQGLATLILFITAYLAGTLMVPARRHASLIAPPTRVNAGKAEACLMVACALATLLLTLDARGKDLFDLAAAYELRSGSADALMKGEPSSSSVWFQIAFLLYPAGYVYIAVHALYASRLHVWKLVVFGFSPIALATVSMGGRTPIFYATLVAWLALRERHKAGQFRPQQTCVSGQRKWLPRLALLLVMAVLLQYFSAVFMTRAAAVGGAMGMFEVAEQRWGVGFRGPLSATIFAVFGEDVSYLIFVFFWYLVQGFVISNYLFSGYEGPLQMGVYGIDLMSALVRRLDPQRLAEGFDSLLTLGTYGFLPSAWGSLYVDFGLIALVLCAIWGAFNALCYRRIVAQRRTDWLVIGPFVSLGIVFSVINTPLGFTNGFVTHSWLFIAFSLLRKNN